MEHLLGWFEIILLKKIDWKESFDDGFTYNPKTGINYNKNWTKIF